MMEMQEYLVIGWWEDTRGPFSEFTDAEDAGDAEEQMRARYGDMLRIDAAVRVDEEGRMEVWWW